MATVDGRVPEPKEPFNICKWLSSLTSEQKAAVVTLTGIGILGICLWVSGIPTLDKFIVTGFFLACTGLLKLMFGKITGG